MSVFRWVFMPQNFLCLHGNLPISQIDRPKYSSCTPSKVQFLYTVQSIVLDLDCLS